MSNPSDEHPDIENAAPVLDNSVKLRTIKYLIRGAPGEIRTPDPLVRSLTRACVQVTDRIEIYTIKRPE